jgi:uncharacterized protein YegP (UPF0339 family)
MLKYCNERFFYYLIKVLKIQNLKPIIKNNGKKRVELSFSNFEGKPSLVMLYNNFSKDNKKYFLNVSNYSNHSVIFYLRRYTAKQEIEKLILKLIERRKMK